MSNPNSTTRERRTDAQLDAELAEVAAAQQGDQPAMLALLARYRPLIAATVGKAAKARGLSHHDREDLQADLTIALLETVKGFDLTKRVPLAVILPQRFAAVLSAISTTVAIPRSTLSRYYAVMKDAEGLVNVAANLAPEHGMTRETFLSIHATLRTGSPEEAELTPWDGDARPAPLEGQAAQVDHALSVLTAIQREVVERAYGFHAVGRFSDDYVAEEMGRSKSYIRKVRETALAKMRTALDGFEPDLSTPSEPREAEPIDWDLRMAAYQERTAA